MTNAIDVIRPLQIKFNQEMSNLKSILSESTVDIYKKPKGFENNLSEYDIVLYDSYSGKPVAWGFRIFGNVDFKELRKHGTIESTYPKWVLITKYLTRKEAIQIYGEITAEEFGPRGGWKSVTFGITKFGSKILKPQVNGKN